MVSQKLGCYGKPEAWQRLILGYAYRKQGRELGLVELRESTRHSLQCIVELVKDYDEPQLVRPVAFLPSVLRSKFT